MLSWRSSNVDEMVLAAFAKKGALPLKEEPHWMVLSVIGSIVVRKAFIGMELYGTLFWRIFFRRALSVGKPPRTTSMGVSPLQPLRLASSLSLMRCQRHPSAMAAILWWATPLV